MEDQGLPQSPGQPGAGQPGPPPSGAPASNIPPPVDARPVSGQTPANQPVPPSPAGPMPGPAQAPASAPANNGGWYNGPWPAPGMAPVESVGSAIARTAIKALTALVILFGLPLLALIVLGSAFAAIGSAAGGDETLETTAGRQFIAGDRGGSTELVAVSVFGPILGEERGGGGGLFSTVTGVTYGYNVKETLAELAEDESVDGILLEVDSPGGTIYGSKAIADGVAEYREKTGKPVVAYVSGISASGGMYAMAGADEIVADHGTLVGSIGVIFGPFPRYNDVVALDGGLLGGGVTTEGGIEFEYLTAGRHKDFGNPYRDMTEEERKTLTEGLDDAYDEFVDHVADGRGISSGEIKNDLGALIFGEQQAMSRGLIDSIGTREEAHQQLADLVGAADGDWRLDRSIVGEPGLLDLFISQGVESLSDDDTTADYGTPADASANLPSVCTGTATLLTYYGDPNGLCGSLTN